MVMAHWEPGTSRCIDEGGGRDLPVEVHDKVILNEVLASLYGEDGEPFELYGDLRCAFLDTIIPADRMRAGVAPYTGNAVAPDVEAGNQSMNSGDEGCASSLDEEMEDYFSEEESMD